MRLRKLGTQVVGWAVLVASACGGGDGGPAAASGGTGGLGTGGTGGADASTGDPLTLLERTPAAGSRVWYRDEFSLTFSKPLDAATVSDESVFFEVDDERLPTRVELDGATVTLRLESVPVLPVELSVEVTSEVRDTSGVAFAGEEYSVELPLWHAPDHLDLEGSSAPALAVGADGASAVAVIGPDGSVVVQRSTGHGYAEAASFPNAAAPALAFDAQGTPSLAWVDVSVEPRQVRWSEGSETGWSSPLALGSVAQGGPQLATSPDGAVLLAFQPAADRVAVKRRAPVDAAQNFLDVAPELVDPGGSLRGFSLAVHGEQPVIASVTTSYDVQVARATDAGWETLGAVLDRHESITDVSVSVAVTPAGAVYVAYLDGDGTSRSVQVRSYDAAGGWVTLGSSPNLDVDAHAIWPTLAASADKLVVAWSEASARGSQWFVAEWSGERYQFLGGALDSPSATPPTHPLRVALDADGQPHVAWAGSDGEVRAQRYNGSPAPAYGLTTRPTPTGCRFPADDAADFPETLTATGCYADVARQTPAAGVVPYDVNSPLWSDGAKKRRYFAVPAGGSIGFDAQAAWRFPLGTVLIKEFFVERVQGDPTTQVPVETRFLVKRCEESDASCLTSAWQGYSYVWNETGTEGTLRSGGDTTLGWPVTIDGVASEYQHIYPSRVQCNLCHTPAAGFALGLRTAQMNRSVDYGTVVDHQLRALDRVGLFGDSFESHADAPQARLPNPSDVGATLEDRSRSYLDANCSNCHHPAGQNRRVDLRFSAPLADNVCNYVTPGSGLDSPLHQRAATRPNQENPPSSEQPMPPLASNVVDTRQLRVIQSWIDGMTTCP